MDDLTRTYEFGAVIYGAVLLAVVALLGHSVGSLLIPFFAVIALALCYFTMMATLTGFNQIILNTLFWLSFGASSIATLGLLWQLIIR